jgi:hypothetical protein
VEAATTAVDTSKLSRGEWVAMGGAVLLAIGVFLPWYGVDSPLGIMDGVRGRGTYSGWETQGVIAILLLLAAIAPFVLAWIVIRDHALSWPRGELTMVISLIAVVLIGYVGIIQRPGEPSGAISLQWGWFVALIGSVLMFVGSVSRQQESERPRKPPGVL